MPGYYVEETLLFYMCVDAGKTYMNMIYSFFQRVPRITQYFIQHYGRFQLKINSTVSCMYTERPPFGL